MAPKRGVAGTAVGGSGGVGPVLCIVVFSVEEVGKAAALSRAGGWRKTLSFTETIAKVDAEGELADRREAASPPLAEPPAPIVAAATTAWACISLALLSGVVTAAWPLLIGGLEVADNVLKRLPKGARFESMVVMGPPSGGGEAEVESCCFSGLASLISS